MTKQKRADYIRRKLKKLYPDPKVPLDHKDPYTLLLAVLLSAQCTDKRVNTVTPTLFAKADNPEEMSKLKVKDIEDIVRPCGLGPAKAKAISELSKIIINKHDGNVPNTMEELEALPGVGHKTASVVMVQIFGVPAFPVDTHIHRLAKHWKLSSGKNVTQTEKDLKKLFPKSSWHDIHLQIIYYGREHFTARDKDPTKCAIYRHCFKKKVQGS